MRYFKISLHYKQWEKNICKTQSNHHNAAVLKFKFQLVEAIKISKQTCETRLT